MLWAAESWLLFILRYNPIKGARLHVMRHMKNLWEPSVFAYWLTISYMCSNLCSLHFLFNFHRRVQTRWWQERLRQRRTIELSFAPLKCMYNSWRFSSYNNKIYVHVVTVRTKKLYWKRFFSFARAKDSSTISDIRWIRFSTLCFFICWHFTCAQCSSTSQRTKLLYTMCAINTKRDDNSC